MQTQKGREHTIKLIDKFASRLGASMDLDEKLVVEKQNKYFLLNKELKKLIVKDFFYAGLYLGKIKNGIFFPSFALLGMTAKGNVNKVIVDKKTEWLFICGRDIFERGIVRVVGSKKRGDYALILNSDCQCLGFGKILQNLEEGKGVVIKNISDIGDFLRREK